MEERIFWGSILGVTIYMLIPYILTRMIGFGVFSQARKVSDALSLTFDDGPHPRYTPLLLDLLKKHDAKATFFVLGSMAERYPDIIQRMHEEGHLVGIHNYTHKTNWLLFPWSVRTDHVRRTADIVENIIGERPIYYRPPWGVINFFDLYLRRRFHIILWSVMVSDWRSKEPQDVKRMRDKLLRECQGGSVVLLHDSGETLGAIPEAPKYMLQALDEVLTDLRAQGLQFVRVDELMKMEKEDIDKRPGRFRTIIAKIFLSYDKLVHKLLGIYAIDENNPFLKIRIRPYRGKQTLQLDDGQTIERGDPIIELHFNNEQLYELGLKARSTTQLSVHMIRNMQQSMPLLSHMMQTDDRFQHVKGIYGISLIHRGSHRFGFSTFDLPRGLFLRLTKAYLRFIMLIVHPSGKDRLKTKSRQQLEPKIIAISREEVLKRFLASWMIQDLTVDGSDD